MTIQVLPQRVLYPADDGRGPFKIAESCRISAQQEAAPNPRDSLDRVRWEQRRNWETTRLEESMLVRLLRLFRGHDVQVRPNTDDGHFAAPHLLTIDGITCAAKFFDGRVEFYPTLHREQHSWACSPYVLPLPKRYSGRDIEALRKEYLTEMRKCQGHSLMYAAISKWTDDHGGWSEVVLRSTPSGNVAHVDVSLSGVHLEDVAKLQDVVGLVTSSGEVIPAPLFK